MALHTIRRQTWHRWWGWIRSFRSKSCAQKRQTWRKRRFLAAICMCITGIKGASWERTIPWSALRVWTICNVLMQRCADFWHRSRKNLSVCMRCLTMKKLEAERSRAQIPRFWRSFWKLFWKISIRIKTGSVSAAFIRTAFFCPRITDMRCIRTIRRRPIRLTVRT